MATYMGSDKKLQFLFSSLADVFTELSQLGLTSLIDTNIESPSNGQVLKYQAATGKWINYADSNTKTLAALTDTTISSPTDGQILKYDGTSDKWINAEPEGIVYPSVETKIGTFNGYDLYRQVVTINATDWNADASISGMYYTDINLANIAIINFDVSWVSPTTSGSSLSGYHKYPCEELHDMTFTLYTTSLRIYAMIPNTSNIGTTQALTIDYIKIA